MGEIFLPPDFPLNIINFLLLCSELRFQDGGQDRFHSMTEIKQRHVESGVQFRLREYRGSHNDRNKRRFRSNWTPWLIFFLISIYFLRPKNRHGHKSSPPCREIAWWHKIAILLWRKKIKVLNFYTAGKLRFYLIIQQIQIDYTQCCWDPNFPTYFVQQLFFKWRRDRLEMVMIAWDDEMTFPGDDSLCCYHYKFSQVCGFKSWPKDILTLVKSYMTATWY